MAFSDTNSESGSLKRALNYPYERPNHSFILTDDTIQTLNKDFSSIDRIPVIACGSNASPVQLQRKFSNPEYGPVYVTRAKLSHFICCYSAHITSYGSIPATLAALDGCQTDCHVTWLTEIQLNRMHKTESVGENYRFSCLGQIDLECEIHGSINTAHAYISRFGNLTSDNSPIPIAEIEARHSHPVSPLGQFEIQQYVMAKTEQDICVEEFILSNITEKDLRRDRTKKLRQTATPFFYLHEEVVLP